MITIGRDKKMEQMLKTTGLNVLKIAGLYLTQQSLGTKLREITRDTATISAQQIRYIRNKFGQ